MAVPTPPREQRSRRRHSHTTSAPMSLALCLIAAIASSPSAVAFHSNGGMTTPSHNHVQTVSHKACFGGTRSATCVWDRSAAVRSRDGTSLSMLRNNNAWETGRLGGINSGRDGVRFNDGKYSAIDSQKNSRAARYTATALGMTSKEKEAVIKGGETDHNPSQSALAPGGLPTILLDEDEKDDVYERAIGRALAWVGGAAVFASALFALAGSATAEEFCAGYLVEQSLSVDNLFVFLLLFDYFKVPLAYQDRVLNWGIYGAIVMRAVMIGLGAAALKQFHAILLVFAAILVYASANTLIGLGSEEDEEEDMSENTIVKFSRTLIDSVDEYDGDRFFTLVEGVKKATPLFICMVAVEISDVVFAVDSIPAVFGVTENPLVVFTSNMFAIMGLRSLYTILSKAASDLEYLEPAVAVVLGFIGSKMIAEYVGYEIPTEVALAFVATILSGGIGLSIATREDEQVETS